MTGIARLILGDSDIQKPPVQKIASNSVKKITSPIGSDTPLNSQTAIDKRRQKKDIDFPGLLVNSNASNTTSKTSLLGDILGK